MVKIMYYKCEEGKGALHDGNLWFHSETSNIYKINDFLFKIYLKSEPHKRKILDKLIEIDDIRDIAGLPIRKIKTSDGRYGMIMQYISNTITLQQFLEQQKNNLDTVLDIIITLSDNLKRINAEDIYFSDLHSNNILVNQKTYLPFYIDLDDATVKGYSSTHISTISHSLHEVESKGYEYEAKLIKYGNLDRESLFVILFNYLLGTQIENLSETDFAIFINSIKPYFPSDFITAIDSLKQTGLEVSPFQYYIGDYLKDKSIKQKCKELRGNLYGYNRFKNN